MTADSHDGVDYNGYKINFQFYTCSRICRIQTRLGVTVYGSNDLLLIVVHR